MTDVSSSLLRLKDISLIRGQRLLFKNLNLELGVGEAIHLKGDNGAGKTSLFKILISLLQPTAGELTIFDVKPKELMPEDFDKIIYLGHLTAIKKELTVIENLAINARTFDAINPTNENLSVALEQVGLGEFREQRAGKLSAGQKRRIMLARLWLKPRDESKNKIIWLLDEPLTALDYKVIDTLQKHMQEHLKNSGGVIFTSHQEFNLDIPIKTINLGDFK